MFKKASRRRPISTTGPAWPEDKRSAIDDDERRRDAGALFERCAVCAKLRLEGELRRSTAHLAHGLTQLFRRVGCFTVYGFCHLTQRGVTPRCSLQAAKACLNRKKGRGNAVV